MLTPPKGLAGCIAPKGVDTAWAAEPKEEPMLAEAPNEDPPPLPNTDCAGCPPPNAGAAPFPKVEEEPLPNAAAAPP